MVVITKLKTFDPEVVWTTAAPFRKPSPRFLSIPIQSNRSAPSLACLSALSVSSC
jgi:hypothetical protein